MSTSTNVVKRRKLTGETRLKRSKTLFLEWKAGTFAENRYRDGKRGLERGMGGGGRKMDGGRKRGM